MRAPAARFRVAQTLALVALVSSTACRQILGTDEFGLESEFAQCGELEVQSGGACVQVGVAQCAEGFARDELGGCEPTLPPAACDGGRFARPGLVACSELTSLCAPGEFATVTNAIGAEVYVGGRAPANEVWFATLAEALANTTGDLTIALARGEHRAGVQVQNRRVRLLGTCATQTTLVSEPGRPAISLGPNTDGSSFEQFAITGPGPGVVVSGAANIVLRQLWLHDLGGTAVSFDDVSGWSEQLDRYRPTSGTIEQTVVQRATDMGIAAYGAELRVHQVQIADVRPLRGEQRALGLVARPGPAFGLPPGSTVEQMRHPSKVRISGSLVENTRGAGILVEGSELEVQGTVIRNVQSDLARHGRGIDVRAHVPGRLAAVARVRQSLIENTFDVGLSIWNADSVELEDTVIRDVGASMTRRCLGNGIRARYDLTRDIGLDERLRVSRSLIERTRQSGLHIEGGGATIEDVLIRDTLQEPCRPGYGDAIAVHASPIGPSRTVVRRSRLERSHGAGVAAFDSNTRLESVSVVCSGKELAAVSGKLETEETSCGCASGASRCRIERTASPSLIGGRRCDAGDQTSCYRGCSGTVTVFGAVLPGATVWTYDHDEIPSTVSDDKGCYELEGLPPNEPVMLALVHDAHVPGLGLATPLQEDSPAPYRANLLPFGLLQDGVQLLGKPDLRNVYLMLTRLCSSPKVIAGENGVCNGLPGLRVALEPGPAKTIYFNAGSVPVEALTETAAADLVFINLAPGEHRVRILPPAGSNSVRCTGDPGGLGWLTSPNELRVIAEEGFTMVGAEVNCALE